MNLDKFHHHLNSYLYSRNYAHVVENSLHYGRHPISLLILARAHIGLAEWLKALDCLNDEIFILKDMQDCYWHLRYVCFKKLNNDEGCSDCIRRFNPSSLSLLRADIDDQVKSFLSDDIILEIPIMVKLDGNFLDLGPSYDGLTAGTVNTLMISHYLDILLDTSQDRRSNDYKRAKLYCINNMRLLENFDDDNDAYKVLSSVSWGLLILVSCKEVEDDINLASLISSDYVETRCCHPCFDKIFNESDDLDGLKQDILITPTDHRIHRVIAIVKTKGRALEILSNFMLAPLVHRDIVFSGHGEVNTGNWCFDDGSISFDEFVDVLHDWEPARILANCCHSKYWGEKWTSEILPKFKTPGNCAVSLSAKCGIVDMVGGALLDRVEHIFDMFTLYRIELAFKDIKELVETRQKSGQPENSTELLEVWDDIIKQRNISVQADPPFPLGFKDYVEFSIFCKKVFKELGKKCESLYIQGSSINGFSWKIKKTPRIFGSHSDYDLAIVSEKLFEELKFDDDNYRKKTKPIKLNSDVAVTKGITNLNPIWTSLLLDLKRIASREVNVIICASEEAANDHTGTSIKVTHEKLEIFSEFIGNFWKPHGSNHSQPLNIEEDSNEI